MRENLFQKTRILPVMADLEEDLFDANAGRVLTQEDLKTVGTEGLPPEQRKALLYYRALILRITARDDIEHDPAGQAGGRAAVRREVGGFHFHQLLSKSRKPWAARSQRPSAKTMNVSLHGQLSSVFPVRAISKHGVD